MTALGVHDGDFKHFDSGVSAVTLAGGCAYHRMIPHTHQHKHTTMCYPSCLVFEHYHYFISISNYQLMLQSSVWNQVRKVGEEARRMDNNVLHPKPLSKCTSTTPNT
jgi:hypothetical protein